MTAALSSKEEPTHPLAAVCGLCTRLLVEGVEMEDRCTRRSPEFAPQTYGARAQRAEEDGGPSELRRAVSMAI
jgi:hypothetical protein